MFTMIYYDVYKSIDLSHLCSVRYITEQITAGELATLFRQNDGLISLQN